MLIVFWWLANFQIGSLRQLYIQQNVFDQDTKLPFVLPCPLGFYVLTTAGPISKSAGQDSTIGPFDTKFLPWHFWSQQSHQWIWQIINDDLKMWKNSNPVSRIHTFSGTQGKLPAPPPPVKSVWPRIGEGLSLPLPASRICVGSNWMALSQLLAYNGFLL